MTMDAMIEFTPTEVYPDGPDSAEVVRSINDKVRVLEDDPSFPKESKLERKMEDIDFKSYAHILTGTILQDPVADEIIIRDTHAPCIWTMLGDETGNIRFEQIDGVELNKFKRGDKIRVIGAASTGTALRLLEGGSVIKMGSAEEYSLSFLEKGKRVNPSLRTVITSQEQSYGGVKIVLHKIKVFDDYTILFLTIENLDKSGDITLNKQGCRLFQFKKQYKAIYGSDLAYREIEHRIPPGIEESGVIAFESLGQYSGGEIRIRLQIWGKQNLEFVFPIKI